MYYHNGDNYETAHCCVGGAGLTTAWRACAGVPAVGEQVLNTLVGLADTFLVGHMSAATSTKLGYSSSAALAGVGLANQIIWLITVLFIAVSVGSTALVARAGGAGDVDTANRVLRQSLLLGLLMDALATVGALALATPAIQMLGASEEMLPRGVAFLQIVALTFTPAALYSSAQRRFAVLATRARRCM